MTKQEKIQAVKDVIVAAVPEIMQPCKCTRGVLTTQGFTSFRCGLCRRKLSWHNGLQPKWCNDCALKRGVCGHCKRPNIQNARSIGLEDVLNAINAKNRDEGIYLPELFAFGHPARWKLGEPIDQQSEAVIDFIYQILVTRE